MDNADKIAAFTYVTPNFQNYGQSSILVSDFARINENKVYMYGVQPSVFDAFIDDFLKVAWSSKSSLSLGEQLYTAKGS